MNNKNEVSYSEDPSLDSELMDTAYPKVVDSNGEIISEEKVILDTPKYDITINAQGQKMKRAKYLDYSSIDPEQMTKKQKVEIYNMLNSNDDSVLALKNVPQGTKITVTDVIFRPFEKIVDNVFKRNVLILLFDGEAGKKYATNSKSIYFDLVNAFEVFGYPDREGYENLVFELGRKKSTVTSYDCLNLKLIG